MKGAICLGLVMVLVILALPAITLPVVPESPVIIKGVIL